MPAPGAHCSDSMDMHESGSTNIDLENEPEVEETSTSDDIENETEEPSMSFTSAPLGSTTQCHFSKGEW